MKTARGPSARHEWRNGEPRGPSVQASATREDELAPGKPDELGKDPERVEPALIAAVIHTEQERSAVFFGTDGIFRRLVD